MPAPTDSTSSRPEKPGARWPMLAVTALLAAGVAFMLNPTQLRFFLALERHRASILAKPETRDFLSDVGFLRKLDWRLPPDARIFFSGVVGPNDRLYPYYFARTFLYPHEVEISLDHKADFQIEGFMGIDCASPEQLRSNGYDMMLKVEKDKDDLILAVPLTQKGVLKQ
jgi:hypothetical protein